MKKKMKFFSFVIFFSISYNYFQTEAKSTFAGSQEVKKTIKLYSSILEDLDKPALIKVVALEKLKNEQRLDENDELWQKRWNEKENLWHKQLKEKEDKLEQKNELIREQKEKLKWAKEWPWFELMRQQIEYFQENNFPQPFDDDFDSKKIVWNKERLNGKTDFKLQEERRYQEFKYYLEHPPNEAVQKLRKRLDIENISVEVFSRGVAKTYRLVSARIHDGYFLWLYKNLDEFYIQEEVVTATRILLDEMGISKTIIKEIENAASKTRLRW